MVVALLVGVSSGGGGGGENDRWQSGSLAIGFSRGRGRWGGRGVAG